jgi:hypothetical protein
MKTRTFSRQKEGLATQGDLSLNGYVVGRGWMERDSRRIEAQGRRDEKSLEKLRRTNGRASMSPRGGSLHCHVSSAV